jgi:hypothetical protein
MINSKIPVNERQNENIVVIQKLESILENQNFIVIDPKQEPIIIEDQNYYNDNMFSSNLSQDYYEEYSQPNIDTMTYEQILELQDRIGYVNKGYNEIDIRVWLF